ncbi:MAG: hypothetical protein ACLR6J_14395 [Parabacteroides merdae]
MILLGFEDQARVQPVSLRTPAAGLSATEYRHQYCKNDNSWRCAKGWSLVGL